jgi:hypothetical protein
LVLHNRLPVGEWRASLLLRGRRQGLQESVRAEVVPKNQRLGGLSNFIAATIISIALAGLGYYDRNSLGVLLLGFWLTIAMFGTRIRLFLND